jgi:hypothetical protein
MNQTTTSNSVHNALVIYFLYNCRIGHSADKKWQLVEIIHDERDERIIHSELKWWWRRWICQGKSDNL